MRPNDVWLIFLRALGVWCNLLCGLLFLSVKNEVGHFWPHSPPVLVSVLYPITIIIFVVSMSTAIMSFFKTRWSDSKEICLFSVCLALANSGTLIMIWLLVLRQYVVPLGGGS